MYYIIHILPRHSFLGILPLRLSSAAAPQVPPEFATLLLRTLMTAESQVISGSVASKDESFNSPFGQNVSKESALKSCACRLDCQYKIERGKAFCWNAFGSIFARAQTLSKMNPLFLTCLVMYYFLIR